MGTMTIRPQTLLEDGDESYGLVAEFEIHTSLSDEDRTDSDRERVRFDEQILAGLVSP